MDPPPTADMVHQGLITLFHNTNPKEKEKANKWLEEFQKSFVSWTVADELLQQKRDLHSCYFAAQTMRNKIQNSFSELPADYHNSLRDSLLSHVTRIDETTDMVIVTQLSLAVADLALLMASWKNPVMDLLLLLASRSDSVWALLEILTLIPEEIDSRFLRLGANRRQEIHKQLDAAAPKVVEFLCMSLQRARAETDHRGDASNVAGASVGISGCTEERLVNAIIRCYTSWIAIQAIPPNSFTENPLSQHIFILLNRPETSNKLHETCTECLSALLNCIEINNNHHAGDPVLEMQIFNAVCSLEPAYHMSVVSEDLDKTTNYCRIFTVMCEAFFYQIVGNEDELHYAARGLDLALICVGHFDYEVAEITFNLWYRLSEELFHRNVEKLTNHFRPHIERLLNALYRHVQVNNDHVGLIDDNDSFSDFRRKVSDLIKDVAFIVGSGTCFKQMFLTLQESSSSWESVEAALFLMQNVAKNLLPDENEIVPKVVEAILNLPENTHVQVRYTSIMLLGELCDWIETHPESLEAVLNFLLYSLQQKNGVAAAAAAALTSICSACRQKMTCHISGLVEIARSLDSFEINNDLGIGLLKGISLILSRLQREQLESAMREIISFQLQPLAQLVEDPNVGSVRKGERTDPAYWIDRACAIIRHTHPDVSDNEIHPTLPILTEAWPLISRVMDKYQTDVHIMERTCRLIRYGIRTVRRQASILVEPLIKQMICLYVLHHHSCFLYLGSVLVDEFAKGGECIIGLLEMLKAFIEPTFSMLSVENGLKNNPETVDDFFRLCSRFIDCAPLPFLQSSLVPAIFECALLSCILDHREANSSVMKFFGNLLKSGRSNNTRLIECRPLVQNIALQKGEVLVRNLIHASVYCLHSYMLPDVAEVLHDLKQVVAREQMERFLKRALEELPKSNSGGYVTATQEQLNDFCNAVLKADTTKTITTALKAFTRLFR